MNKQVKDLFSRGLSAVRLGTEMTPVEKDLVEKGLIPYVFSSPESLQERRWKYMLLSSRYQSRVKAVFIDEAHCVEVWGSGKDPFRKSYDFLGDIRSFLPDGVPFCALTATASKATRQFIIQSPRLTNVEMISLSLS